VRVYASEKRPEAVASTFNAQDMANNLGCVYFQCLAPLKKKFHLYIRW
jgi:hypothetical protein